MAAAQDPAKKGQKLEEDDEFEEFQADDWVVTAESIKNEALWDKSWDDDNLNDHIGQQLRALPQQQQQQQHQQQQH